MQLSAVPTSLPPAERRRHDASDERVLQIVEKDRLATDIYLDKLHQVLDPMPEERKQDAMEYLLSKLEIERCPDAQGRPKPAELYFLRKLTERIAELDKLLPPGESFTRTADQVMRLRPTLTAIEFNQKETTSRMAERSHMVCRYRDPGESIDHSFKRLKHFCVTLTKHHPLPEVEALYDHIGSSRNSLQPLLPNVRGYDDLYRETLTLLESSGHLPGHQLGLWLSTAIEEKAPHETLTRACERLGNFTWLCPDLSQRKPFMQRLHTFVETEAADGTRFEDVLDGIDGFVESRRLLGSLPPNPLEAAFRAATSPHRRHASIEVGRDDGGRWLMLGDVKVQIQPRGD